MIAYIVGILGEKKSLVDKVINFYQRFREGNFSWHSIYLVDFTAFRQKSSHLHTRKEDIYQKIFIKYCYVKKLLNKLMMDWSRNYCMFYFHQHLIFLLLLHEMLIWYLWDANWPVSRMRYIWRRASSLGSLLLQSNSSVTYSDFEAKFRCDL